MAEPQEPPQAPDAPDPDEQGAPRSAALAVVVGGVILIGLIAFAYHRKNAATVPAPVADARPADAAALPEGTPITAVAVTLTPEAAIATERYRCVCSCNDPLSICTCTQTPGSIDMKRYVQELVNGKKTPAEMDQAMLARYGEAVLLTNPPVRAAGAAPPAGNR